MDISEEDKQAALSSALAGARLQPQSNAARLLRYIVAASIEGRDDQIKAVTLGQDVLNRGQDFDPSRDSAVRVEVKRLRRALDHYYRTDGARDPVRISIPTGQYAAAFVDLRKDPAREAGGGWRGRAIVIILSALVFAALSALIAYLSLSIGGGP